MRVVAGLELDGSADGDCTPQSDDCDDKRPEDDEEDLSCASAEDVDKDEIAIEGVAWFLDLRLLTRIS
jgi:hypothetical protein